MFTFKFLGLNATDAPTPYYYGSLPAKPEPGHTLVLETGNRYAIVRIEGEGLVDDGDGNANQKELAWADISRGEKVPTLWLQKLVIEEMKAAGRSFSYEEVKEYSQRNREARLSASPEPLAWLPTWEKIVGAIRQVVGEYNRAQGKELYGVRVADQIRWQLEVFPLPVSGFDRIATVTLQVSDQHAGKLHLVTPPEGMGVNRRGDFRIQDGQIVVLPNFTGNPQPPKEPMTPEQFARDTMEPLLFPEVRKAAASGN